MDIFTEIMRVTANLNEFMTVESCMDRDKQQFIASAQYALRGASHYADRNKEIAKMYITDARAAIAALVTLQ